MGAGGDAATVVGLGDARDGVGLWSGHSNSTQLKHQGHSQGYRVGTGGDMGRSGCGGDGDGGISPRN